MSNVVEQMEGRIGERGLAHLLEHHYRTRLTDIQPVGGVLKLGTDQGTFVLKQIRPDEEGRWKLIGEVADYFAQHQGKPRIPAPIPTHQGKLSFAGFHGRYILLPWIKGQVIPFNRAKDWRRTARAMARMHQLSSGFVPSRGEKVFEHTGHWSQIWQHLLKQVQMFQRSVDNNQVDQVWLRHRSYTEGMLETALTYLEKVGGDTVCQQTRKAGNVCHGNVRRKHVLRDERGQTHFLGWDQMVLDIRSRDLARFIQYAYRKTGKVESILSILRGYQQVAPLDEPEYALIYTRLLFPDRMIRTLDKVYRQQTVSHEGAVDRLSTAARKEEEKTPLLTEYPEWVKREFDVTIPKVDWLAHS